MMMASLLLFMLSRYHVRPLSMLSFVSKRQQSTSQLFLSANTTTSSSSSPQTALVWLRSTLRLQDNESIRAGARFGRDGMAIVFTWQHGSGSNSVTTPSSIFECAAAHSLDKTLRENSSHELSVLYASSNDDAIIKVAKLVDEIRPSALIVDATENPHDVEKLKDIAGQNDKLEVIAITDDSLLFPTVPYRYILGRSRQGGKILRWSTFLKKMADQEVQKPIATGPLPPPLPVKGTKPLPPVPKSRWAKIMLERWGEISEEEALRRARQAPKYYNNNQLGSGTPTDTKLSPYLRWGVISPRQAAEAGVRKRDLLWREWSHICFRLVKPLQRGEAVIAAMDGCCKTSLDDKYDGKFKAWCVGRTGSAIVDAGMRQLWLEGWMPRHVRLLAAACLVEGLGVDFRLGRDWFKHTLIDHDPAINELMWQNGGLCGIDPFYKGMRWEATPDSLVDYAEHWNNVELHWPSSLSQHAEKEPPSHDEVLELSQERRNVLNSRGVYRAANTVAKSGVRVAWPGATGDIQVPDGEVCGVGRVAVSDLTSKFNIGKGVIGKDKMSS